MSLLAFQRAMSDLVASADLCNELLREPESVLDRYDLTPRERRRLTSAVSQRGMAVNCSLYRANRITPLYRYMPYTCFLLGDELMPVMLAFWERHMETPLQFRKELETFGEFMRESLGAGAEGAAGEHGGDSILLDAVEFEMAVNTLRFTTRSEAVARLEARDAAGDTRPLLHPFVRVVRLRHDPGQLLNLLAEKAEPPYRLDEGEFWLVVDAAGESLEARPIERDTGRLLAAIEQGTASPTQPDLDALAEAGLVV